MIDEEQLKNYLQQVREILKGLGAKSNFIKTHLTEKVGIDGILNNYSPEYLARSLMEDNK